MSMVPLMEGDILYRADLGYNNRPRVLRTVVEKITPKAIWVVRCGASGYRRKIDATEIGSKFGRTPEEAVELWRAWRIGSIRALQAKAADLQRQLDTITDFPLDTEENIT